MNNQLTKEEVKAALHFDYPPRPPLANSLWHNEETKKALGAELDRILKEFPDDVIHTGIYCPYWDAPEDKPNFRWAFGNKRKPENVGIDNMPVIEDWSELTQFLNEMPDPHTPDLENGIILTSSNSIHSSVKPENYLSMIRAAREYGQYPITVSNTEAE